MSFFDHLFFGGYSQDLHEQLKGLSADCSSYNGSNVYQATAIVLLLVSLVLLLNYYYGLFNDPRFTYRRVWLLHILVACLIVGGFAYLSAASYLPEEKHCSDLHFGALDCSLFALTEMGYTAIVCILLSLLLKWKSVSNKKIPF